MAKYGRLVFFNEYLKSTLVTIISLLCGTKRPRRKKGVSVSHRTKDGETALMRAAGAAHLDTALGDSAHATLLAVLIKGGADVNARDNQGKTPLMYAAAVAEAVLEGFRRDAGQRQPA